MVKEAKSIRRQTNASMLWIGNINEDI